MHTGQIILSTCFALALHAVDGAEFDTPTANTTSEGSPTSWINVCYFTNWARYRTGLINKGKDIFEMGVDESLCTHFMYGFAKVRPDAANGGYTLESWDPNADHPSGSAQQDQLCPEACNDPNFKPDWSDPDGLRCDWPCSPSRQLRGFEGLNVGMKAKNPAIKSLISVGGWNFNDCARSPADTYGQGSATCEIFSDIAAVEEKIRKFAANVIGFCRKWGFDGFDFDWEYPVVAGHNSLEKDSNGKFKGTPEDYVNYINMLRILKEELLKESSSNPLLLTAAVGVGKSTVDTAYDIPEMSKYLDLINLMTYDIHGAWDDITGCNANLFSTEDDAKARDFPMSVSWAVDYWLKNGAPASKLTMGLATYGRGFRLQDHAVSGYNAPVSGASRPGVSTKEAGYLSYYEIHDLLGSGATAIYDEERQCPYVVSNGEWIGYDNEQSFCAKLNFAQSRGLAGSMIWAMDLDDFDGKYSGGEKYSLIRLASQGGSTCSSSPATTSSAGFTTESTSTTIMTTTASSTILSTTATAVASTTTTTTMVSSTMASTTTATTTTTTTTVSRNNDAIQSGDIVFLRTYSGNGNHIDVEGSQVQARWRSRGQLQAMVIQKEIGGAVHSGDTIYLKTHTGAHLDVEGEAVQARFNDRGNWQALVIEKRTGSGVIFPDDVVCLKAHTGKHVNIQGGILRARWNDCGDWQAMGIERETENAVFSGSEIHLSAHTGKRIDVEGAAVQARWSEAGEWQTFVIENYGGRAIFSGDAVFIRAHTGNLVDVQGSAVHARWKDHGDWQRLIIEKRDGIGAVLPGDSVFLRAHTGNLLEVQGDAVQARWSERGDWQSLLIERAALRRLAEVKDEPAGLVQKVVLV